ncbi:hypothetical protein [Silvibacterium dinghuense]|uniref:hypothetical protein n=1 Tax=Silvibacterium dinghuense TaxID=1560006 RepID=UPI0013E8FFFF|nr:hypothetical protein [Silvibacterium dinghuense]GGG94751.1 hypothetical protein GCM10011586_07120 [Silvibacterium dinghuense]
MAAFCACCGAEITPKSGPCTLCGAPQHGSLPAAKPSQNKTYPGISSTPNTPRRVA